MSSTAIPSNREALTARTTDNPQNERMADIVQAGLTPERFPIQAGRAAELVKPPPHVVPTGSSAPA